MTMPADSVWSCRAGTVRVMLGDDMNVYVCEDRLRADDEHPFMVSNIDALIDALLLARTTRTMRQEEAA